MAADMDSIDSWSEMTHMNLTVFHYYHSSLWHPTKRSMKCPFIKKSQERFSRIKHSQQTGFEEKFDTNRFAARFLVTGIHLRQVCHYYLTLILFLFPSVFDAKYIKYRLRTDLLHRYMVIMLALQKWLSGHIIHEFSEALTWKWEETFLLLSLNILV